MLVINFIAFNVVNMPGVLVKKRKFYDNRNKNAKSSQETKAGQRIRSRPSRVLPFPGKHTFLILGTIFSGFNRDIAMKFLRNLYVCLVYIID